MEDNRFNSEEKVSEKRKAKENRKTLTATRERLLSLENDSYGTNLISLQIDELVSSNFISNSSLKGYNKIQISISKINKILRKLPSTIIDSKKCPSIYSKHPISSMKSINSMKFIAPTKDLIPIGSSTYEGSVLAQKPNFDFALTLPSSLFTPTDALNFRYATKRALYLNHITEALKSSLCSEYPKLIISWTLFASYDTNRPILQLTGSTKLFGSKKIIIRILPYIEPESIPWKKNRFHPSSSNVRPADYIADSSKSSHSSDLLATPLYNTSLQEDSCLLNHSQMLTSTFSTEVSSSNANFKTALQLLKTWLWLRTSDPSSHSISPDSLTSFHLAMIMAYLRSTSILTPVMSPYQMIRLVLNWLSSDSFSPGSWISFSSSSTAQARAAEAFASPFPPSFVFLDKTDVLNLTPRLSSWAMDYLSREAALSLSILQHADESSIAFQSIFLTPHIPIAKADFLLHFRVPAKPKKKKEIQRTSAYLQGPNWTALQSATALKAVESALTDRISLAFLLPWSRAQQEGVVSIAIILNPKTMNRQLELGPPSNDKLAAATFAAFWGELAHTRRFNDGRILEAVYWDLPADTSAETDLIPTILKWLFSTHLKDFSLQSMVGSAELSAQVFSPSTMPLFSASTSIHPAILKDPHGTLIRVFSELSKKLRSFDSLPLSINNIYALSPALRYTSTYPPLPHPSAGYSYLLSQLQGSKNTGSASTTRLPLPLVLEPIDILLQFERSSKWPEDLTAIFHTKLAFLAQLAEETESQGHHKGAFPFYSLSEEGYLDLAFSGYLFRLHITYDREYALLDRIDPKTARAERTRLVVKAAHGLALQQFHSLEGNTAFSPTVRLVRRWLGAQFFSSDKFPIEAIELTVAHLFLNPAPYTSPSSSFAGFIRWLHLMCSYDFKSFPLIVNIDGSFTGNSELIRRLESNFDSARKSTGYPALVLPTGYDQEGTAWTTNQCPSELDLKRLIALAKATLNWFKQQSTSTSPQPWINAFKSSVYDSPKTCPFHALIYLDPKQIPSYHKLAPLLGSSSGSSSLSTILRSSPWFAPIYKNLDMSMMKLEASRLWFGFNPVGCYLEQLKERFGNLASFYHDENGGHVIGVVWRAASWAPSPWSRAHLSASFINSGIRMEESLEDMNIEGKASDQKSSKRTKRKHEVSKGAAEFDFLMGGEEAKEEAQESNVKKIKNTNASRREMLIPDYKAVVAEMRALGEGLVQKFVVNQKPIQ